MNILSKERLVRFMHTAYHVSEWSKDSSTKVGTIIIDHDGSPVSWGYNGMPRGVNDDVLSRHERPEKYLWMLHSERNALDQSHMRYMDNCVLFTTHFPCSMCAGAIINNRIKTVVYDMKHGPDGDSDFSTRWRDNDSFRVSLEMFKEANVEYIGVKI